MDHCWIACMHTATANGIISLARPWGVLVHIMAYLTHQKYYQIVTSKENEASADFWTEGIYSNPWKGQRHLVYLHPAHAVQRPARWSCPSLTLRRRVLKELLRQAAGRFFQTWWLSMPSTLSFFRLIPNQTLPEKHPKKHPSQTLQQKTQKKHVIFVSKTWSEMASKSRFPMNLVSPPDLASSHWFKELQVLWCWPKIGGVTVYKKINRCIPIPSFQWNDVY